MWDDAVEMSSGSSDIRTIHYSEYSFLFSDQSILLFEWIHSGIRDGLSSKE